MKTAPRFLQSIVFASILSTSALSAVAATDYSLTGLEDNGNGSTPLAIAPNGLIAGTSNSFGSAYFWNAAGNRLYSDFPPATYTIGYAMNSNGLALVDAQENAEGYFLWNNGKYSPIPAEIGTPSSINDAGQIATRLPNGSVGLWSNGTFTDLGVFPGGSGSTIFPFPIEIGNNGQIVGSAVTANGAKHAALWKDGTVLDLGTLPGDTTSVAMSIGSTGEVFGFSYSATQSRPFRWANGVMTALAPAGIFDTPLFATLKNGLVPKAMNSRGQIVAETVSGSVSYPFVWENGVTTDLSPLLTSIDAGKYGCRVNDINDAGQIIGRCDVGFILTPVGPGTNLAVSMSATPNPVALGGDLTYNLSVSNLGSLAATSVNLVDVLPTSTSFKSVSASQGSCSGTTVVTCNLGNIAGGVTANVQIVVAPNLAGALSNSASVSSNEVDTDLTNNSATASVTVSAPIVNADAGITMTRSASTVTVNTNLTYTINVTNSGPASASGVTLNDTLPAGLSFVSATASQGTCSGAPAIVCTLGNLAAGASATAQITVTPTVTGTLINSATVTINETDTNTANNSASASITVNAPVTTADAGVRMTGSASTISRNGTLTYTIRLTNSGPGSASNVTLRDVLPTAMKFVSASSNQGTCSGTTTVTCAIGPLANGGTASVSIVVKASARGTFTNTATVSTSTTDNNTSNNSSSVRTRVK